MQRNESFLKILLEEHLGHKKFLGRPLKIKNYQFKSLIIENGSENNDIVPNIPKETSHSKENNDFLNINEINENKTVNLDQYSPHEIDLNSQNISNPEKTTLEIFKKNIPSFIISQKIWNEVRENIFWEKINLKNFDDFKCSGKHEKLKCINCLHRLLIFSLHCFEKNVEFNETKIGSCQICSQNFKISSLQSIDRHALKHVFYIFFS